jgi:two-component system, chemotaxis family, response regulator WspR
MSEVHPAAGAAPEISITPFKVRVLLVDDQLIIIEAVRRMLADQPDIEFHYVSDPHLALGSAETLRPTVILQDLLMPDVDGFDLIRQYRASAVLEYVPVIVLSAKEEPKTKAQGFAWAQTITW